MQTIVIVDDEVNVVRALERSLGRRGWQVESFTDPRAALKRLQTVPVDLVLSDYRMPQLDGVQLLSAVRAAQSEAMRLILSAHTDREALLGAINEAAIFRFLSKPWNDYELLTAIDQALAYRAVLVENRCLADEVRRQREHLTRQRQVLERLERLHPGITRVSWGADGAVLLDGDGKNE